MTQYLFFLILAALLNAGSNVFYKYSSLSSQQKMLSLALLGVGLLLGAVNVVLFTKSLKGISMNVAYPIYSAGTIVLVTIASILIFGENVTVLRVVGISVISLGVILVSL
jgi:multidrug transporter EmrE-like cation transporter